MVREVPVDDIKSGKYKVPELKKLKEETPDTSNNEAFVTPASDAEEVPFD